MRRGLRVRYETSTIHLVWFLAREPNTLGTPVVEGLSPDGPSAGVSATCEITAMGCPSPGFIHRWGNFPPHLPDGLYDSSPSASRALR